MIKVGTLAKIRRLHLREGVPIKEIERRTGIARNTIKSWLRRGQMVEPKYPARVMATKLDGFTEQLATWLKAAPSANTAAPVLRCVLSLAEGSQPLAAVLAGQPAHTAVWFLSGPEGGLSPSEDAAARAAGFVPVTLGPRVLRAETAALAALVLAAH